MRDTWTSAKVGSLVVIAIIASVMVYRLVDESGSGSASGYTVHAVFEDAQGLVSKSKVLVAGIQVGRIEAIKLEGAKARVELWIREDVVLHKDATVTKKAASFLGEVLLVIHPGSVSEPAVPDGDRITAVETLGTGDIMNSMGATVQSVEKVAEQLQRTFGTDEGGQQMQTALKDLSEALAAVNRTIQQNEAAVDRTLQAVEETATQAGPKIVRILEDVEVVTQNLRGIVGNNPEDLGTTGGQVKDTIASLNRSARQLEDVLADIKQVTGRTADGEGTIGKLTSDSRVIDEVEGVAEDLGELVEPIARLQTIVGLRSEYNFLAETFKNYFSLRLQPREDRYYLFELINDPRGLTEFTQTAVRRSPPPDGEPAFYQETRVETRDAFRFSLMMAKRIHFATFRFGILESTGGVGTDFHLFEDKLELTADVFAVGEQTFPRLRTRIAFEFISKLWLLGGIDDALNESSDFFMGFRLRFNDQDLKSILPFTGGVGP